MNNIIFLDIDGVLNGRKWVNTLSFAIRSAPDFDPVCCALLQKIIDATGASLVISSSWREIMTIKQLDMHLDINDITAPIVGVTPRRNYRHEEIKAWLAEHPSVTNYVVLDDMSMPELEDRRVRTDEWTGLVESDVEKAIDILMKKLSFNNFSRSSI